MAPLVDDLLLDGRLRQRGIFNPHTIDRLWSEHRNRVRDHRHRLWSLVMLELWFREFADVTTHSRVEPNHAWMPMIAGR